MKTDMPDIIAKYITRDTHKGSVNRIRHLMAEELTELTLKQVLSLIGEDEKETWYNKDLVSSDVKWFDKFMIKENPIRVRNQLRAKLRQSAERIWK